MKRSLVPASFLVTAAACALAVTSCGDAVEDTQIAEGAITIPTFPTAKSTVNVGSTIKVSGTFDGGMKRYQGKTGSQSESQPPIFDLAAGSTIQNVIIGNLGQDGIHCEG